MSSRDSSNQPDAGRDPVRLAGRAIFLTIALFPWLNLYLAIDEIAHKTSDMASWGLVLVLTLPLSFLLTVAGVVRLYLCYSRAKPTIFWWLATALAAGPFLLMILKLVSGFDVDRYV